MQLLDLLDGISYRLKQGTLDTEVSALIYDSRKAVPGAVFVCIAGSVRDAHTLIPEAVKKGVTAVIVEKDVPSQENLTVIQVENTRYTLALMSAAYFGHPAEKLITVGVTGTKGKTTTACMIQSVLANAGLSVGLVGTIETVIGERRIPSANTTPESYELQEYFSRMVNDGIQVVVMEVSSQGLMLQRVAGFTFDYGIFTNLEPDHIGEHEHKDFEEYMYCKSLLFRQCKRGILNHDSPHLAGILAGHTCTVETYGCMEGADLHGRDIALVNTPDVLGVSYRLTGLLDMDVTVNMPGMFSVYNSMAAIALCRHFDISQEVIREALFKVSVKGRIERIPISPEYTLMIDYAHNAMALKSLLTTIKEYRPGRLVSLFGCGGNRAKDRRYQMGEVSSELADVTVVTSDNPRFEDPIEIMEDILTGVKRKNGAWVAIPDRREAIAWCIHNARPGDVIVLAGKGHEDYQEIRGEKYPMDERELIRDILSASPARRIGQGIV